MSSHHVNGDKRSSAFISHLTSYPLVHDSISGFKSTPLGQMSLDLADQSYATFAKPVLPYLSRPFQYVSPYVHKADHIADQGLSRVEQTFPIVKSSTDDIKGSVQSTVWFPVRVVAEGKQYVFEKWDEQYKSTDGNGVLRPVRAALSTGLVVTAESFGWLGQMLGAKKEQTKQTFNEKIRG
ncbi:MAG: hypothetical protein M1815_001646 [Lichina confinis]|nr:MAG: hypothetical protein M1815_001646 [Lichina confinis]